nr:MAG: hypothetical protein DIU64_12005 [Caldicoprobacter oshimai]
MSDVIGRVTSTKDQPSSANTFYFWVKDDVIVNLFDFVSVDNVANTRTVGIIKDLFFPTEAEGHLTNYISSDFGDINAMPPSNVVSSCIAKVDVLGNTGKTSKLTRSGKICLWYPPKNFAEVRLASSSEIDEVLGTSLINPGDEIPSGFIINSNDHIKPIYYDKKYLLGPEAGHLNISGISGLATKTSYAMFLLWMIFQKQANDTCAILFNVKQRDLLYIDEPATDLAHIDYELYKSLNITNVGPFDNVTYLFPAGLRDIDTVYGGSKQNVEFYSYQFLDVHDEISFLFSDVYDPSYTLASICEWLKDRNNLRINTKKYSIYIDSWSSLRYLPADAYPSEAVGNANKLGVVGRFQRHLARVLDSNIFKDTKGANEVYLGEYIANRLTGGRIFVVDIQPFEKNETIQGFIIGDIINRVLTQIRNTPAGQRPKNIIFFIDELNRYVPNRPGEPSALAQQIIELARVGRAEGITLFGAEQFMSGINHQVYENCANIVLGRSKSTELSKEAYSFLDKETKFYASKLQPGEMIIINPLLSQPVKIIFPKPPYRRQS